MFQSLKRWVRMAGPGGGASALVAGLRPPERNLVLILCTGNICRSPMACALLRHRLARQRADLRIESAGISAVIGAEADPLAIQLMAERGIDITGHRARQVTPAMLSEAGLVLVMEQGQVVFMRRQLRVARKRIYRLCHEQHLDVPDPYRGTQEDFAEALTLIEQGVEHWLPLLDPDMNSETADERTD